MERRGPDELEVLIRYGRLEAHARDRVLDQFYLIYHAGSSMTAYLVTRTLTLAGAFLSIAIPIGYLMYQAAALMHLGVQETMLSLYAAAFVLQGVFFAVSMSRRSKSKYKEHPLQPTELGLTATQVRVHSRNIHGGYVKSSMRWQDVSFISVTESAKASDGPAICLIDTSGRRMELQIDCIQTIEERQILRHFLLEMLPQVDVSSAANTLMQVGKMNDVPFTKLWSQALQDSRARVHTTVLEKDTILQGGTYVVKDLIASGGQGAVYLSSMRTVDGASDVVLKEYVLPDRIHEIEHKNAVEQFEHEVRLLGKIDHPGVIKMINAFVEDHRAYLVLEHIDGVTLKQLVEARGALPEAVAVRFALQLCDILALLHSMSPRVMHLDFSPDNILVGKDDRLTTIDFNVSAEEQSIRTRTVMGKQRYMSPEQYRGKPTTRSDIYSVGASIYFLITGMEPQPISVAKISRKVSSVSAELDAIIEKATALEESDRYQTIEELHAALKALPSASSGDCVSAGTASQGTASAGTASQGTASAGTASLGTASAGTASQGTASAGTAVNESESDGTILSVKESEAAHAN